MKIAPVKIYTGKNCENFGNSPEAKKAEFVSSNKITKLQSLSHSSLGASMVNFGHARSLRNEPTPLHLADAEETKRILEENPESAREILLAKAPAENYSPYTEDHRKVTEFIDGEAIGGDPEAACRIMLGSNEYHEYTPLQLADAEKTRAILDSEAVKSQPDLVKEILLEDGNYRRYNVLHSADAEKAKVILNSEVVMNQPELARDMLLAASRWTLQTPLHLASAEKTDAILNSEVVSSQPELFKDILLAKDNARETPLYEADLEKTKVVLEAMSNHPESAEDILLLKQSYMDKSILHETDIEKTLAILNSEVVTSQPGLAEKILSVKNGLGRTTLDCAKPEKLEAILNSEVF